MARFEIFLVDVDVFEWHGMVYIGKFKLNMTTVFHKKLILVLGANTILFE